MISILRASSLALLAIAAAGCNDQSALETRRQQLAYTPETLAVELAGRLDKVHDAPAETRRRRQVSRSVAIEDKDRGVDRGAGGDRPDPFSRDVFVEDVARKIKSMSEDGSPQDTLRNVIDNLRSRKDVNPEKIDWLENAVTEKLQSADG